MAYPRPKILTRVTVPTGGWAWDIDVSVAAQYDTNLTGTVPAGDYYVSGDHQSDDLLYALANSFFAQYVGAVDEFGSMIYDIHPTSHKVRIQFFNALEGSNFEGTPKNNVRMNLDSWDADLCAALGFDGSAAVSSTGTDYPVFTADWHHAYGFYCDEDGQGDIIPVDRSMAFVLQDKSISGKVKTQFFGESFASDLSLQFLERYEQNRTKVFSDGIGYGVAPTWPYSRNEPLECWWEEARKGIEFRVYRDAFLDVARASETGTSTDASTSDLNDTNKSFSTQWPGRVLYVPVFPIGETITQSFYISSNTSTRITVANALLLACGVDGDLSLDGGNPYYLFEHTYKTYVADLKRMSEFAPRELPVIDRWNIRIPLLRYV